MIAPDMNRLFFVMLVFFLGGCGALSPSASQSEDTGRRLVGDSEGFSAGGLDADSVGRQLFSLICHGKSRLK